MADDNCVPPDNSSIIAGNILACYPACTAKRCWPPHAGLFLKGSKIT